VTWQLVYTVSNSALNGGAIAVPYYFNSSLLIVEAICPVAKPRWHEAGWLKQVKNVPNVGITKKYLGRVFLEKQEVPVGQLNPLPYTLEFIPRDWIPTITLNFWENDELITVGNADRSLMTSRFFGIGV
jgi:hypothetical protein